MAVGPLLGEAEGTLVGRGLRRHAAEVQLGIRPEDVALTVHVGIGRVDAFEANLRDATAARASVLRLDAQEGAA